MNREFEWDDLRYLLAIDRAGTLSGAARALGVSHATVFRRLGQIEHRLGVAFFERTRGGYSPTAAGELVAATAGQLEADIRTLEGQVIGRDLKPSGTVDVTTTDTLLNFLLPGVLSDFCAAYPQIDVGVRASNDLFDLSLREADVAIRPAASPPEHLIGRNLGVIRQAIFGRPGLVPDGLDPLHDADVPWVGPDHRMPYPEMHAWVRAHDLGPRCRLRVNSVLGMYTAAKSCVGLAVLPEYIAQSDPGLVRYGDVPELNVDLWVLAHASLKHTARVRAFMDFVAKEIKGVLQGLDPAPAIHRQTR